MITANRDAAHQELRKRGYEDLAWWDQYEPESILAYLRAEDQFTEELKQGKISYNTADRTLLLLEGCRSPWKPPC